MVTAMLTALVGTRSIWLILSCLCGHGPGLDDSKVKVIVVAILGHNHDETIDEKIQEIARHVQKREPGLTGFSLKRTELQRIPIGESHTFELVDEATMDVKVEAEEDGSISLTLYPPETDGSLTYSCKCGKFFPIITRYETENKERLIVAVMAEPCRKANCGD